MLLTALLGASLAAEPVLTTALAVAGWESGLQLRNQGGVKHTLYADPESTLLGDVYVRGDVLLTATPDYLRGGLQLEFSPMAMLVFRLRSETTWYWGAFKTVIGFESPTDAYLDEHRDLRPKGTGHDERITGTAIVRAKVGPVIVAAVFDRARIRQVPDSTVQGSWWFDPEYQLLLDIDQDRVFQQTTVALYQKELASDRIDDVMIGAMSTYRRAQASEDALWRAGPMAVVNAQGGNRSVLLLVQPYVKDQSFGVLPPFVAVQGTAKF